MPSFSSAARTSPSRRTRTPPGRRSSSTGHPVVGLASKAACPRTGTPRAPRGRWTGSSFSSVPTTSPCHRRRVPPLRRSRSLVQPAAARAWVPPLLVLLARQVPSAHSLLLPRREHRPFAGRQFEQREPHDHRLCRCGDLRLRHRCQRDRLDVQGATRPLRREPHGPLDRRRDRSRLHCYP